ncbi:large conductance mechanosensitive channel protein MscL [Streptomyces sp. WMMB303]|uniref:large conductance mechanosensitive channel protein MscL n=1 Tax=Streptomyces sp. WMMB303 TaxID=3034154 RepID=UPI0023ECD962|nr:large conductance mechanosensitive channel protein MscL [Streptomyces sp. WMMB303]MDF4251203.1 large conductance mechanosensitive channel protein MscL [Streptomyces sp. WMMB303]
MSNDAPAPEKKGVLTGFREFLMRGNVVELAVAVVIGAAFSKIVDAVVNGFLNPLVGAIGTKDLDKYRSCLKGPCEVSPTGEVTAGIPIHWGPVLSATLTFLITAAVVYFLMILPMNRFNERRAAKAAPEETAPAEAVRTEVELLTEIRDALLAQRAGGSDSPESPASTGAVTASAGPVGPQRDGDADTRK